MDYGSELSGKLQHKVWMPGRPKKEATELMKRQYEDFYLDDYVLQKTS